jgi:hypothetical protein
VPIELDGKFYMGPWMGLTAASTGLRFQRFADRVTLKVEELKSRLERDDFSSDLAEVIHSQPSHSARLGIIYQNGRICIVEKERNLTLLCSPVLS